MFVLAYGIFRQVFYLVEEKLTFLYSDWLLILMTIFSLVGGGLPELESSMLQL
jgi:hypothetical protein